MRINEFQKPTDELFEDSATKQVLDVALSGDAAWSQPMSPEDMKASLMALINHDSSNKTL